MKRMLLAAATSSLLVLAAPGVASAHHAKCHGRSHHACAHLRRAHHARIVSFGSPLPSTGVAPLLRELLAEYAATGMPPAYLSSAEATPPTPTDQDQ